MSQQGGDTNVHNNATSNSLIEAIQSAPRRDTDIEPQRGPLPVREISAQIPNLFDEMAPIQPDKGSTNKSVGNWRETAVGPLYLSFWHLSLENLPEGRFENRKIRAADASKLIGAARTDKTLQCVSYDDLLAPYKAKERRRHEELCSVLCKHYDCALHLEDFLCAFDEEQPDIKTTFPLDVVQLKRGDCLLIVTGGYEFLRGSAEPSLEDRFVLSPDSVEFNLIEAL
jgi:hypothetical protein